MNAVSKLTDPLAEADVLAGKQLLDVAAAEGAGAVRARLAPP